MIREGPLMRGLAWVQSAVAGVGGGQALDLRTEPTTIETQGCSPVSVFPHVESAWGQLSGSTP